MFVVYEDIIGGVALSDIECLCLREVPRPSILLNRDELEVVDETVVEREDGKEYVEELTDTVEAFEACLL